MTRVASIEEWQVLSCLEVEPDLYDPHEPWLCNHASYTVKQGELTLLFTLSPFCRDVRLALLHQERCLYEMSASDVADVVYRRESDVESIDIALDARNLVSVRSKPHIS